MSEGSEAKGYKRVGRKGGERREESDDGDLSTSDLLLCCIGIINMMQDGCLISQYCPTKLFLIKSH